MRWIHAGPRGLRRSLGGGGGGVNTFSPGLLVSTLENENMRNSVLFLSYLHSHIYLYLCYFYIR